MIEQNDVVSFVRPFMATLSKDMAAKFDAVCLDAMKDSGIMTFDLVDIMTNAKWLIPPDGRKILVYKDKPLVEFYPLETQIIENKFIATQQYRILSRVASHV